MEDKKTNGQQAEQPAQGTQEQQTPSAWLQEVATQMSPIGEELDQSKSTDRGLIVIAIDENTPKGSAFIGIAGGSFPIAKGIKAVLTAKEFSKHLALACQFMAQDAMQNGKGTIVIETGNPDEEETEEGDAESKEADADE